MEIQVIYPDMLKILLQAVEGLESELYIDSNRVLSLNTRVCVKRKFPIPIRMTAQHLGATLTVSTQERT
jgi:hypothetical protein